MADNTTNQKMWQSAVSSTADCLPLEVLEKMTETSSAVDQKAADQKAAAHLTDCPNCQTELSLLKNFEASVPSADEGAAVAWIAAQLQRKQNAQVVKPAVARVSIWRAMFRVPYLAGVAALAVVLALGVSLHHSGNQENPAKIGGGSDNVSGFRAGAIHLKSPVGNLPQAPVEFRWEAFPGASSYSIELRDAIGTVLATKTTKENVIVVTPEMKANMASGKPLKWKITALDAAGNEIANSTGGDFKIN
jgi:hypothetical protein